jgi:hypothetical protein
MLKHAVAVTLMVFNGVICGQAVWGGNWAKAAFFLVAVHMVYDWAKPKE